MKTFEVMLSELVDTPPTITPHGYSDYLDASKRMVWEALPRKHARVAQFGVPAGLNIKPYAGCYVSPEALLLCETYPDELKALTRAVRLLS